jgi:hypothetical protein
MTAKEKYEEVMSSLKLPLTTTDSVVKHAKRAKLLYHHPDKWDIEED